MTDKNKTSEGNSPLDFLTELREFAIDLNAECPEGHRKDPASGRCLPMGSIDHTSESRSKNVDHGPEWRGEVDKTQTTTIVPRSEVAIDASEMDEPESCSAGTTFSFIQRRCVSMEDAEAETNDEYAMTEENEYVEEEAAAPGVGGHQEIVNMQPEGRRDTLNHKCPPNQFFDYKRRACIPLNKDSMMASEIASKLTEEEKKELAAHLHGKVAMTSPDPLDNHTHLATLDASGNGKTSICGYGDESHSHDVVDYVVKDYKGEEYTSRHFGHAVPKEVYEYRDDDAYPAMAAEGETETAAPIKSKQRNALPDSSFGVPGKRKFPLDTCARVRNAMARFNQAKNLSSSEKVSLRRKILARAKACNIEVTNFAKAETPAEFAAVVTDLMKPIREEATAARLAAYEAEQSSGGNQGPCPPGMEWSSESRRCSKVKGFYDAIKDEANHAEIVGKQPEGRRDTINHDCPPGEIFDFGNRKCIPMDTSSNPGQPGDTTKASEEGSEQRKLSPQPAGRPTRLPIDCPKDTIWSRRRQECIPLDSSKKTKSAEEEEAGMPDFMKKIMEKKKKGKDGDKKKEEKSEEVDEAQTTPNGNGGKKGPGCPEGQFMNPVTKKCMPRKGAFKGKSEEEVADAKPGNREGLTPAPAGKVQHPSDCPPDTAWDAKSKVCRPLDSMDKSRPSGSSPQSPKSVASEENVVENMSLAKTIAALDEIIAAEFADGRNEKAGLKVAAKDLPNDAFPPSLVSATRRSLMHHSPDVTDPYDTASVDVARLRNALSRSSKIEGFAEKAVADAQEHLLWHARQLVSAHLGKA